MTRSSYLYPWTKKLSGLTYSTWSKRRSDFTPLQLQPYAYYDANLGGSASGITDSSNYARAAMTVGAGSNSPLWLPYTVPAVTLVEGAANSYSTAIPGGSNLPSVTDYSIRFRIKIVALGTSSDTCYLYRIGDYTGAGILPYLNQAGELIMTNYDPGYNPVTVGDLSPYVGQWIDIWIKFQTGTPGTATGYYRAYDPSVALSSNAGWSTLSSGALVNYATTNGTNNSTYGTIPVGGGVVSISETMFWKSATPSGNPDSQFVVTNCAQSGYTDSITGQWFIGRTTSGRKIVVQSPAANSARSMFLLGTDDWFNVPVAAVPAASSTPWTIVSVYRIHGTPAASMVLYSNLSDAGLQGIQQFDQVGVGYLYNYSGGTVHYDGTSIATSYSAAASVNAAYYTGGVVNTNLNGVVGVLPGTRTLVDGPGGANSAWGSGMGNGAGNADAEFIALLTFNYVLSASQLRAIRVYYKGVT